MRFFSCLLFLCVSAFVLIGKAQSFQFWQLNSQNGGLPSSTIQSILQDTQGFMWFGGIDGLYRYDGYQFYSFKAKQGDKTGLLGNNIKVLYEDKNQVLWIATTGKGLHYYDRKLNTVIRLSKTEGMYINALKEDKDGNIWLSSNGQLGTLDIQNLEFKNLITKNLANQFNPQLINDFVIINTSEFWVGTANDGLFYLNLQSKQVKHFQHNPDNSNSLSSNQIERLYLDQQQILWIGTRNGGLCKFDTKNQSFKVLKNEVNDSLSLGNNTIFDIKEIKGKIWVATDGGGLNLIDKQTNQIQKIDYQKNKSYGISVNNLRTIYPDNQGRIWIGTHTAGVNVIDEVRFKFKILDVIHQNQVVTPIFRDSKARLWVGTDNGVFLLHKNQIKQFTNDPLKKGSLGGKGILSITEDSKQNIWLGGWGAGLNLFDEKTETFKVFLSEKENTQTLSSPNVMFLRESKKTKQLFVATWDKLNVLEDKERGIFKRIIHEIPDSLRLSDVSNTQANITLHIGEDTEGYFWLGSYFGLHRFDPQTHDFKTFTHSDKNPKSISSNDVLCFYQDHKGRKWVGTTVGLNLMLPNGDFQHFNISENITVQAILGDRQDNLWLSSNVGLLRFNTENHTFKVFDKSDGLQGKEFRHNSAFADKDGTFYFGGLKGLNYFHPDSIEENKHLPQIYLTDFKIFNQSVKIGEYDSLLRQDISQTSEITLSHEYSVFTLDFVGLNFTQPEKNQYAYQLEGFDKKWNYIGNQRSTTYTNLDAGTYTFIVKASNNDGLWSKDYKLLKINILPPWWATWWFRSAVLLFVIISAVSYYQHQTNRLRKRNALLEQKVVERTKDLRLANEQIKAKNEELQTSEEELRQNMEELATNQEQLRTQKEQLEYAFQELNKQSTKVNDSIRYAQRIQNAILPHEHNLASAFEEHFIVFKPKDVVSGDFYWYLEIEHKKFLAVVDCTGHGVPGAFMSMIGNTLLHEIITAKRIFEPHLVLEHLHLGILNSLNKKNSKMQDGMDIALCCIEEIEENKILVKFSGAKRPLYCFSNQELNEIKANRRSIGQLSIIEDVFITKDIILNKNSILYMTTDGWIDAINPKRERFGSQRFKEMLVKGANIPLYTQKELFNQILEDYEQGAEQRDDILMVGVRI